MDLNEKRRRRLEAVDNEQAVLAAMMPFIERLEDCHDVSAIIEEIEDMAALVGSVLAEKEGK